VYDMAPLSEIGLTQVEVVGALSAFVASAVLSFQTMGPGPGEH
jgi:hypothetical protein